MNRMTKAALCVATIAACASAALAQWGTTSTNTLVVGDATSDVPLIAPTTDGGCYIAWQGPVGGVQYNAVHLQRLDAAGHEMWPHNGIVAVPGNNSAGFVGDFDLAIASDGNALIVNSTNFSDAGHPTVHQANVQKFAASDGHKLWGTGGADVAVTTGTLAARPVHVCSTPDGGCIVGYTLTLASGNGAIRFMRLDSTGGFAWASPTTVLESSGNVSISLTQMQPAGADGSFIGLWGSGVNTSTVALHTQKFTGAGAIAPGWGTTGNPLVLDSHGLTGFNYYQWKFISDGAGGGIYGWSSFANSGFSAPTDAFIQHYRSDGSPKWAAPISLVDPDFTVTIDGQTQGRFEASVAYNPTEQSYFLAGAQGATSNGVQRSVVVQKFDSTGNRLYGLTGFTVVDQVPNTQIADGRVVCTATNDGGCIVMGNAGRGNTTIESVVFGAKVNLDQFGFPSFVWNKLINSDASTSKGRNAVCLSAGTDDPILAFTWASRVAAARVTASNGNPGVEVVPLTLTMDVQPQVDACEGDTIVLSIAVTGTPTIGYRWQRHYAYNVPANPDAYWSLDDGDSSFNCVLPADGTTYSGTHTNTLTIHNVHANNPSATCPNSDPFLNQYRCYVFNSGDSTLYSGVVQIVINGGACCAGGGCTFVCNAAGCSGAFQGLGTTCTPSNPCGGGACCIADTCTTTLSNQCGGSFMGAGTTCAPSPCPGACCDNLSGTCSFVPQASCSATTGVVFTAGGSCSPNACAQPGACCNTFNGSCTMVAQPGCSSGGQSFNGAGTVCEAGSCPATGACCNNTFGNCAILTQAACGAGRTFQGPDTLCSPSPCPQPGACCNPGTGACTSTTQVGCAAGSTFQDGGICSPNPCQQPAACCNATTGACTIATPENPCTGYLVPNSTTCSPSPCPAPVACCQPSGCFISLAVFCSSPTASATCAPDPCAPATGACCNGASCSVTTSAACAGVNTHFAGSSTTCNAPGDFQTPCCKADYNKSGFVSVQDIFDFLSGYFTGSPSADVNGVSGVTVQDIFDFLSGYFTGC